jgi:hypothetical protein
MSIDLTSLRHEGYRIHLDSGSFGAVIRGRPRHERVRGRSNILVLERAWNQAQEHGDVKALTAIFDDSLISVDCDGKLLTKAEYMTRVKANATRMEQIVALTSP